MEQEQSQINISAADGQTITVLHGKAPLQENTWKRLEIKDIVPSSITDYVAKSKLSGAVFPNALISVSYSKFMMAFENDVYRDGKTTLLAVVKLSMALQSFGINDDKVKFNKKSFENLLRRNKRFFGDAVVHSTLLRDIQNLKAKREVSFENANDKRSNVNLAYNQKVMEKPFQFETFEIDIPLFENHTETEVIPVEMYYELGDSDVVISLHSDFLYSYLDAKQRSVIDTEIAKILELYPLIPVLVDA